MIRVLAVLVVAVLPLVSFAEVKIGYIDSGKIFQEYKGMESITKQFNEEQTEWQRTAEEMLRELETLKNLGAFNLLLPVRGGAGRREGDADAES